MAPLFRYFPYSNQAVLDDDEYGDNFDMNLRADEEWNHHLQEQVVSIRRLVLQQIGSMKRIMEYNSRTPIRQDEVADNFRNNDYLQTKIGELESLLENLDRVLNETTRNNLRGASTNLEELLTSYPSGI